MAEDRPTGTVTFLFTDIEGSTRVWEREPDAMASAVAAHDEILRRSIENMSGHVFALGGDSFAAAFTTTEDAAAAASTAQQELGTYEWPTTAPLRVRMGLHTGVAEERAGNYFGPTVNRAARVMSAGHGGQVLLSAASASLLGEGHVVRRLGERRLDGVDDSVVIHQLGDDAFPPLRAVRVFTCDLPEPRTGLIGREHELVKIDRSIETERLVTLVGAGGTGKTRLAFEAGRAAQARFEAGVRLVDLTTVVDPDQVDHVVAAAVDAGESADPLGAAVGAIGARDTLLVVDNCEHVIDAIADCLDELLAACSKLRVLATSREPLEIDGEAVYPVPPLAPDGAAVQLFRERVAATGVDPDQFDDVTVRRLCARLDGLPLAVELAAGRARSLTPLELIERLDEGADLESGRRRRRRRHDTLEDTIAWSYDLLSDDERCILRRASLFEAEFVRRGVQIVSGLSLARATDALDGLVAKSLIVRVADEAVGDRSRYRLLETIRDFAARRLAATDRDGALDGLVDYMVALFDAWLDGESRITLLQELWLQRSTIATAARRADAVGRIDVLADILQLWMLIWLAAPSPALPEQVIGPERIESMPEDVRGRLVVQRAIRALNLGDVDAAVRHLAETLELSAGRDSAHAAVALSIRSRLVAYIDPAEALELADRAWAMKQTVQPPPRAPLFSGDGSLMWQMQDRASVLAASGDADAAWSMLLDSLAFGPDANPLAYEHVLNDVVWTSLLVGEPGEGLRRLDDGTGAEGHRRLGGAERGLMDVARAAALAASGDPVEAQRRLLSTIESWGDDASSQVRWSLMVIALGVVAWHAGDLDRARRLLDHPVRVGMAPLMVRRQYLSRLGVRHASPAPLASAGDADVDPGHLRHLIRRETQHLRLTLTDSWDDVASGWAARHDQAEQNTALVALRLIELTAPAPGETVLELAAGTGGLGHRIAPLVAPAGTVISSDVAPDMVAHARRIGAERHVDNVDYRVLDAHRLAVDSDSIDIVVCRFGFMVMPDPEAALTEARRVLRPDGHLAFSVFTTPAANPWISAPSRIFSERGHLLADGSESPGIFSMGDPDRLRSSVIAAGFETVEINAVDFAFAWADDADAWALLATQNSLLSRVIAGLDEAERSATRSAVVRALAPFRLVDGSYRAPAQAWIVHAR